MITVIINLWVYGTNPFDDPATDTIGPFTEAQAKQVCVTLTCEHRMQRISTLVPEWALS